MKTKQKKIITSVLACILIMMIPISGLAHSGRTDSSGGHKDNKNKSGLGYYHYHCGGYPPHLHNGGVCPYKGGGTTTSESSSGGTNSSASTSIQTLTPTPPPVIYASKVKVIGIPETIDVGNTTRLEASVYPENAEDKEITWSSDNPEIVAVDSKGNLTAKGVGTANITAQTARGTSFNFTVKSNEVIAENIVINNAPNSIFIGKDALLSVKFIPENTTNKSIVWTTNNEDVISISSTGRIVANNVGTAQITATHKNLSKSVNIVVLPIEAESIDLTYPAEEKRLKNGENIKIQAVVLPANTTDKTLKWSVDNDKIAEIDKNGVLTAKGAGTVTVTAEAANGKKEQITVELYSYTGIVTSCVVLIILAVIGFIVYLKKDLKTKEKSV